ncbi:DUF4127 family protein [Bacillus sp. T33-2]|uniref:DUF4127 family protein n=1 Tax=Bacillus sp. T33-2 TaxID=2054168 RepID=UPI000C781FE6|nr:DUF4127 family protein [Bacillus sp. T33-2]PLR95953.1 hypothetical protein CVD19_13105 [Bacillus sp. T33-2]
MQRKIALIPVDARPVTRDLPCQLASIGGWEVLVPETEMLGFLRHPGNVNTLSEWIKAVAPMVDGFVISTDMIGYGGLVPSRINMEAEEVISARMNTLRELKSLYPDKKIMAFSATMRISNNYVNEEEKEYWKDFGEEIWAYSYHSHRFEKTKSPESEVMIVQLAAKIPPHILEDYVAARTKNFNLSLSLLYLVEEGIIDVLVYPQDDTSEYGFNIREQELLSEEVMKRSLFSKVFIYPGADEVANTLVSRMIYQLEEVKQPSFFPIFSGEKGALSSAMYEDRPISESVKGQIFAFGGHTADCPAVADIILAVNVPGRQQGDLALQKNLEGVDSTDRNIGEWISRIKTYLANGKMVAIADVAYANGADGKMMPWLLDQIAIDQISGFAAWNTAGNTLGTAVAQASMIHLQKLKPSLHEAEIKQRLIDQLAIRLLDDYIYQTTVRQQVRNSTDESSLTKEQLLKVVEKRFFIEAVPFLNKLGLDYDIKVYLPWNRTFEIGLNLLKSSVRHTDTVPNS